MLTKREKIYTGLKHRVGHTPLIHYFGDVKNENKLYLKLECDNPFGSHYDRVYLDLFRHYESIGKIRPGDKILETTSGAAGASFAAIGRLLGYDCYVILPAGGEKAREYAIKQHLVDDGHLLFSPAEEYIGGFREYLKINRKRFDGFFFMNHSMGPIDRKTRKFTNNELTLNAVGGIATEVIESSVNIDYFLPAVGNGSSLLGPARVFGKSTKVIAWETFQSGAAFSQMYPGEYENRFGISSGTLSRHKLPGTSFIGIDFPHIRNAIEGEFVEKIMLVSDKHIDSEYTRLTGRTDTLAMPHWDIHYPGCKDLGRTTRAAISVALMLAEEVRGKTLLVIAYDKADRYDSKE